MNFFTKLFKKKAVVEIPPMPSWETVVEMMYDRRKPYIISCQRYIIEKFIVFRYNQFDKLEFEN